jgi:hypothetical protein
MDGNIRECVPIDEACVNDNERPGFIGNVWAGDENVSFFFSAQRTALLN